MLSAVLPVKAQRKSYVQLKAAYEGGFINYTCESAGMEVVYGYRTDGMVSAGVGTGLFWSSQSYDKIGMDYSSFRRHTAIFHPHLYRICISLFSVF